MSMLKVEGHDKLIRDPKTKAILNTDENGFRAAKLKKKNKLKESERLTSLESQVSELNTTMQEILAHLKKNG